MPGLTVVVRGTGNDTRVECFPRFLVQRKYGANVSCCDLCFSLITLDWTEALSVVVCPCRYWFRRTCSGKSSVCRRVTVWFLVETIILDLTIQQKSRKGEDLPGEMPSRARGPGTLNLPRVSCWWLRDRGECCHWSKAARLGWAGRQGEGCGELSTRAGRQESVLGVDVWGRGLPAWHVRSFHRHSASRGPASRLARYRVGASLRTGGGEVSRGRQTP